MAEGPKENPLPVACLFGGPNIFAPLFALPNGEPAAWPPAPAPNNEPDGAVLDGVLPKNPPPVVGGAVATDPKAGPGTGALDVDCPKSPAPPFGRVV